MHGEKFCLRWNDFQSNISNTFGDLSEDTDFLDVTLVCGEEQLKAHKVILAACSPFFQTILKRNPHPHPLLYLKSMGIEEMKALLDFMYHGEVNVAEDKLATFLSAADELQVKGLTEGAGGIPGGSVPSAMVLNNNKKEKEDENMKGTEGQPRERHQEGLVGQGYMEDEVGQEYKESVQQPGYQNNEAGAGEDRSVLENCLVRKEDGMKDWQCVMCGKTRKSRSHMIEHVESAHYPYVFDNSCPYCEKKPSTKSALRMHIYSRHKDMPEVD